MTYSKFDDIEALLAKASGSLKEIEQHYKEALHSQTLNPALLVEIKDYQGNLRSALDYLNGKVKGSDRYFPIRVDQKDFEKRYGKIDAAVRTVLQKWQPFNGNAWFRWFNVLNNKNKHHTLMPQIRRESVETRVTAPRGGAVSWTKGVTFGSGVSVMGVPIDPKTQLPIPNDRVKTERIIWVDFHFDNKESPELPGTLSGLPFLRDCFDKITKLIAEVEALL
jgi:hypothetical protein